MTPVFRNRWKITPREAIHLQARLRERVVLEDAFRQIRYVAGADIAFDPATEEAFAGVVVYRFPSLEEVERRMARRRLQFPYVPGLLSFREIPILMAAFARLKTEPDLLLIDGHGRAHPRLFGIACHVGVLFDKPSIGCAKSLLVGEAGEPGLKSGSIAPLDYHGETVGTVLRTRDNTRPIFVTQGNRISLATAVKVVMKCVDGYRIPRPTREADHYVRDLRCAYQEKLRQAGCGPGARRRRTI